MTETHGSEIGCKFSIEDYVGNADAGLFLQVPRELFIDGYAVMLAESETDPPLATVWVQAEHQVPTFLLMTQADARRFATAAYNVLDRMDGSEARFAANISGSHIDISIYAQGDVVDVVVDGRLSILEFGDLMELAHSLHTFSVFGFVADGAPSVRGEDGASHAYH